MFYPYIFFIIFIILAYLFGSINNGVIIGKFFFKTDIREHGSKGAGSTNTLRTLGIKAALPVFILDILKPIIPVLLARFFLAHYHLFTGYDMWVGFFAVLGQCYPLYFHFKGGKGAASTFGLVMLFFPMLTLLSSIPFFLIFFTTRYVSLATLVSSLFLTLLVGIFDISYLLPMLITTLLIYLRHAANIKRLMAGNENKTSFHKK